MSSETDIWYQDTTEHVREIRALREQVATLTRERDEARSVAIEMRMSDYSDTREHASALLFPATPPTEPTP